MRQIIIAASLFGPIACHSESVPKPADAHRITSAELRAHIDLYTCATWLDDISAYEARFGDPRCVAMTPAIPSPVQRAIEAGMADAAMVVPLAANAYDRAYAELESPNGRSNQELDTLVRAIYWSDPHLGPAAESRVVSHLAEVGIHCADCSVWAPPPHVLDWSQFEIRMIAYMWPSRLDGEAQTHIHVCSALNGVHALGLEESEGLEAGFLAALAIAEDPVLQDSIRSILVENPEPEPARIQIERLLATERARQAACDRVLVTRWFTGVQVPECSP